MKYGLMSYDYTINLGNEIQSIAARRFLPKIDYYIDHEKIHEFGDGENVKMIMNAWYLDCLDAWPPSENIDPLLISMHFNSKKETQKVILSDESREYLSKYGPVGCRDIYTQNFLEENGIDAYFSGCLTLTLDSGSKYNYKDEDNDYILISSDKSAKLIPFLKEKTNKRIYVINQDFPPSFEKAFPGSIPKSLYNFTSYYNAQDKFFIAENILRLYENAGCVITDRLHCALPCLALETPVLLFNSRPKQERFDGLNNLLLQSNFNDYLKNYNIFDVDNPPENSKEYLKIREKLIEKCKSFTGHINESCYSDVTYNQLLDRTTLFLSRQSNDTRNYMVDVLDMAEKYEKKIQKQQETIEKQKKIIEEYKNSTSWKITSPLRKLKR